MCHGVSAARITQPRRNLMKRHEHKCALRQPWMRNLEIVLAQNQIAEQENVEVERARAIPEPSRAVPSEVALQIEQSTQQLARSKMGLKPHNGVEKSRLIGKAHRRRGVKR